jgi:hypothetical protein
MVKKIEARTGDAPEQARTGGPGDVESLDSLAAEGAAVQSAETDQARAQVITAEEAEARRAAAETANAAKEIAAVLVLVRDGAAMMADEAGALPKARTLAIWTDDTVDRISAPLAVIIERHAGGMGEFMQQWGPYLMLLAATALPAGATIKAVREHRAATAAMSPAPGPDKPAAEGGQGG